MDDTLRTAFVLLADVVTPVTCTVLPIPYELPPSIILTEVTDPLLTVTLAVAYLPVVDAPIETNFAL